MHLRQYFVPCGKSLVTNVASRFLPLIEVVPSPWIEVVPTPKFVLAIQRMKTRSINCQDSIQ